MDEPFRNRQEAGLLLGEKLVPFADEPDLLVLGLPRGGVVVAYEVAQKLNADLDVFVVRKLGAPFQPELAMGAIAGDGITILNDAVIQYSSIRRQDIERIAKSELIELKRREKLFRNGRPPLEIKGKTVIVVDDGLATGATMRVAVKALKRKEPKKLIAAVPVAAQSSCLELKGEVDEAICLRTPEFFNAVGSWYFDFEQTTDEEVTELLEKAHNKGSE